MIVASAERSGGSLGCQELLDSRVDGIVIYAAGQLHFAIQGDEWQGQAVRFDRLNHMAVPFAIGGFGKVHKLGRDPVAIALAQVVADDVGRLLRRRRGSSATRIAVGRSLGIVEDRDLHRILLFSDGHC